MYAKTREECEALLPGLIQQMKAEIKKSWRRLFEEIPEEGTEAKNIQGAVWRLKQEWILGIE